MRTSRNPISFRVAPTFYFVGALLLLIIPLRWLVAAAVSAAVHELCHIAAIRAFGIPIHCVKIGVGGATIETQEMSLAQELVCALAGPFGGMLLLLVAKWFPVTAVCAGFHTIYNLLPVYPQDGGRALRCGARMLLPDRWAAILCNGVECVCLVGVAVLGIYGTFILKVGIFPVIFTLLFLRRSIGMKNSLQRGERRGTI